MWNLVHFCITSVAAADVARGSCYVCGAAGQPCSNCLLDYYCSKAHQKQDWPRHRAGCGVLEVRQDEALGRHLVLTKDVPAGTVLLRERPLVHIIPPWAPVEFVSNTMHWKKIIP